MPVVEERRICRIFPHLGSAGTGEQKGAPVLFKKRGQVADLGGLAASLDPLEGNEKAQFSSAFLLNELYPKCPLFANGWFFCPKKGRGFGPRP
jgi:hypothetical protein